MIFTDATVDTEKETKPASEEENGHDETDEEFNPFADLDDDETTPKEGVVHVNERDRAAAPTVAAHVLTKDYGEAVNEIQLISFH